MARSRKSTSDSTAATIGYEAQLWQMADALRGSMDTAIEANLRELGYGTPE